MPMRPSPYDVVEASRRVWLERWDADSASGNAVFTAVLRAQQMLMQQVHDVMKAHGCTIVVVSHKPGIFRSADKMLVLRDGRMEMFGPRDAVWARVTQAQPVRAVEASR